MRKRHKGNHLIWFIITAIAIMVSCFSYKKTTKDEPKKDNDVSDSIAKPEEENNTEFSETFIDEIKTDETIESETNVSISSEGNE